MTAPLTRTTPLDVTELTAILAQLGRSVKPVSRSVRPAD